MGFSTCGCSRVPLRSWVNPEKVETNQQKVRFKSNKLDLYNPQKIGVAHEETMGIQ